MTLRSMKYFIIFGLLALAISSSLAQDTIGNSEFPSVLNTAAYLYDTSDLDVKLYQVTLTSEVGNPSGVTVDELTNATFFGLNGAGDVYALQANPDTGFGDIHQYTGTPPPFYQDSPLDVDAVNTTIEFAANFLTERPLLGVNMTHITRATLGMSQYVNGLDSSSEAAPAWGFFFPANIICSVSMDRYAGCAQSG